jgi:hypothetical protein
MLLIRLAWFCVMYPDFRWCLAVSGPKQDAKFVFQKMCEEDDVCSSSLRFSRDQLSVPSKLKPTETLDLYWPLT